MRKAIAVITLAFFMLNSMISGVLVAAEDTGSQGALTIEQAIDIALKNSNTIKQHELSINRGEEVRNSASDNVKYIPSAGSSATSRIAYSSLVAANIGWEMARKTKTIEEEKLAYSVFNKYTDLIKFQANLAYAQNAMNDAQWQWNINQLCLQQGTISSFQRDAGEVQYKVAQINLKTAEIDLKNAYEAFNKLLGLNSEQRPLINQKPDYSYLNVDDIEVDIQRVIDSSPAIWRADQNVDLAKNDLELYDWTSIYREPYKATIIDVEKAQLTADDARGDLKLSIRTFYNSIRSLEEKYVAQQEVVKNADDALRVKKLMFDVGMATKSDVQTAELALEKQKNTLDEIIYQHELLKLAYKKPWTYSV